jgi:hypothetical protein
MPLLFLLCQWHALVKLRQHHDYTLGLLDTTTAHLASQFRKFEAQTCATVNTLELPREAAARAKRAAKGACNGASTTSTAVETNTSSLAQTRGGERRQKRFNLGTPKYHALGHYAWSIRQYGSTDSYSSEIVSISVYMSLCQLLTNPCRDRQKPTILRSKPGISALIERNILPRLPRLKAVDRNFAA